MKRDMDVIRKILLTLDSDSTQLPLTSIQDINEDVYKYHAKLLKEAGYVWGGPGEDLADRKYYCHRLTWSGHELAAAMANQTIWNKAKQTILQPGVTLTIGMLVEWLKQEGVEYLKKL